MGFPIKKRINGADHGDCGPAPRGLDLLSAAIDAQTTVAPSLTGTASSLTGTASSLTGAASGSDGEETSAAPEAAPTPAAAPSRTKRARPFPAILRDILSDPAHEAVVSWLPHGRSFAVHDTHAFSSEILPKYFRKVVFRSFARKLNRWGFRSVRKGVSGIQVAFEHDLFRRDEPELSEGMRCLSNPTMKKRQAVVAAGRARASTHALQPLHPTPLLVQATGQAVPLPTGPAQTHTERPVISPQVPGMAALVAAASAAVPVRPQGPFVSASSSVAGATGLARQVQEATALVAAVSALQTAQAQARTERSVISSSSSPAGAAGVAPQVPGMGALAATASALRGNLHKGLPAQGRESAVPAPRNAPGEELAQTHTEQPVVSSSSSPAGAAEAAPQVPGMAALATAVSALRGRESAVQAQLAHLHEELPAQGRESAGQALQNISSSSGAAGVAQQFQEAAALVAAAGPQGREAAVRGELVRRLRDQLALRGLQELRRREREREVLRFLRETPASQSDAVSRYIAEKLARQVLEQRRGHGGR